MAGLTRDDARARAALVTVEDYDVQLDLDRGAEHFGSTSTIRFSAVASDPTFVDIAAHALHAVTLNDELVDVAAGYDATAGRLAFTPRVGPNTLVVAATMTYSHDGEGMHRHVDPVDKRAYLYAMSFLDAAPRWFACFDQPDLKAGLEVEVRCPSGWLVAGNGPAREVAPGHWRIGRTGALATYFTTVVAGPYHAVRDEHDGIPLVLYARRSLAEHLDREAAEIFRDTKHSFAELHRLFGRRYPWGEYHQAFVPDFPAAAMENAGCVAFRDSYVFRSRVTDAERVERASVIAHEMAHMWFGDLVTMRWWDDLWLNESFAEYLGHRVVGDRSWIEFGSSGKPWGYAADRRPSTHPIAGNGAADTVAALAEFDGISYAKGAAALRQLALQLGDDVFLDGLRRHIGAHAGGNAELGDLLAAFTAAGAPDIDGWADAWLRTTGVDELAAGGATGRALGASAIARHSPDGTPRPHAVTVGRYSAAGVRLAGYPVLVTSQRTAFDPLTHESDLFLADSLDQTWAKTVLTDVAWQRMPTMLPLLADCRTRVAVWSALRLAVDDAQLDPALAVQIAVAALPVETDDAVLGAAGEWVRRRLLGCFRPADERRSAGARLCSALLASDAEPGSSRQLAATRLVASMTSDCELLAAWRAGRSLAPGIVVDTDLRWRIVTRLARLGQLDAGDIAAEVRVDNSSHGIVQGFRCRAALPDAAAKAAAWTVMMSDAGARTYDLYATAEGFWDPDQSALTEPYVERYAAEIAGTAALRAGSVTARLALLAYPWTAVAPRTLVVTDALLADDGLDAAIRRSVVDAGDDLRRAVTALGRFQPAG